MRVLFVTFRGGHPIQCHASMPSVQGWVYPAHTHAHTQKYCVFQFEGCEGLTLSHTATFGRWNSYQRDS